MERAAPHRRPWTGRTVEGLPLRAVEEPRGPHRRTLPRRRSPYRAGYLWCARAFNALHIDMHAFVEYASELRDPNAYPAVMSHFHVDQSSYVWVSCDDVSLPHNPHRLPAVPFEGFRRAHDVSPSLLERLLPQSSRAQRARRRQHDNVRQWLADLTPADLAGWSYMDVDWVRVLDAAGEMLYTVKPWSRDELERGVLGQPDELRGPVRSLFVAPITCEHNATEVTDGQHRAIAMTVQGVERILVARP